MLSDEVGDVAGADTESGDGEQRQLDPSFDQLPALKTGGEVLTIVPGKLISTMS